jgi:hypothetical protein
MTLVLRMVGDPRVRLVALALASGVPLALYVATASAHDGWLDSAEFVAASVNLGIAHPPGHPLAAILGKLLTLVPIGPLPWRVAMLGALSAAIAAGALFRAIETTVRSAGIASASISLPLAVGATWLAACAHGFWLQAVRPEVYAIQAALICVAIERIVHLEAAWPTLDVRPLFVAALCVGLALANHHFLAFLLFPALAPTLARVLRAHGPRPLFIAGGALLAGLATYVYLPLRAARAPVPNLGVPTDLDRLVWVVSARAYQHTNELVPEPLGDRVLDVIVQLVDSLHVIPLLLAVCGLYTLARTPGARRLGFVWGAVLVVFVAARAWLGFVRSNPDALGYLMPAFGAAAALAASFVGTVVAMVGRGGTLRPSRTAVVAALLLAALGLAQAKRGHARASLARFTATDDVDDAQRRALPQGAVLIAHAPATVFRFWGAEASERLRPDVTLVPMPFLGYPGMIDALVREDPDLAPLLRSYLLDGELRLPALQSLASSRPVLVELDVRVPQALYETLVPRGGFHEVLADGATELDARAGRTGRDAVLGTLLTRLGLAASEPGTRDVLLWLFYNDALYYAAIGDRDAARDSTQRARKFAPLSRELEALELVLSDDSRGPLDVTPYLPSANVDTPRGSDR